MVDNVVVSVLTPNASLEVNNKHNLELSWTDGKKKCDRHLRVSSCKDLPGFDHLVLTCFGVPENDT